jgi:hypothetical protein
MSTKYSIVREACDYCWSKKSGMMDRFQKFMETNAFVFVAAPQNPQGGEQDLEMYELFNKYLELYEDTLSDYIKGLECSITEFYHELDEILNDKTLPAKERKLLHFANYLVASTNYESFYKIMVRAAKRFKNEDAKAEAKKATSGGDSKGEGKAEGKMSADDDVMDAKADFK